MKQINLVDLNKSDVKYEIFSFPDGEKHIKLEPFDRKESYQIATRIKSGDDLFLLAQVGDILKRAGVYFTIKIYYLMSMRMDRVMTYEEAFSLNVVANIINEIGADLVQVFHPHSDATYRLINNCQAYDEAVFGTGGAYDIILGRYGDGTAVCYPDAGAATRYRRNTARANCITLSKKRDINNKGAITNMEIKEVCGTLFVEKDGEPIFHGENILIIDDLCDGGRTFIEAAKLLRAKFNPKRLGIFVRHLVNRVGMINLVRNFDDVYVTNSYDEWNTEYNEVVWNEDKNFHVINIIN